MAQPTLPPQRSPQLAVNRRSGARVGALIILRIQAVMLANPGLLGMSASDLASWIEVDASYVRRVCQRLSIEGILLETSLRKPTGVRLDCVYRIHPTFASPT